MEDTNVSSSELEMSNLSSSETPDDNSMCESDLKGYANYEHNKLVKSHSSNNLAGEATSTTPLSLHHRIVANNEISSTHAQLPSDDEPIIIVADSSPKITSFNEDRMKRKLHFFFMNPIEKWQTRKRFPYKFLVQLIKMLLVTMQICLFAHSRYNHVNYTWDNRISFSHLFLRNWDATMEVEAYPPAIGPLAVYVREDFFATVDYAIKRYQNLSIAIGPYSYPNEDNSVAPLLLCLYQYKAGTIFGFNESYIFNSEIDKTCMNLTGNVTDISSQAYLASKDVAINFSSLVKATLEFSVKTVNFKVAGPFSTPDCYRFDISILLDNTDHDGQMLLSLDAEPIRLHCQGDVQYITESEIDAALRSLLNTFVIVICIISFALCTRAIYRAILLKRQTIDFFRTNLNQELSFEGRMEFINLWYVMIIFNDCLLILGSSMKEQIERSDFTGNDWNTCSVLLGVGNLLVWFGVLRYLGFFKSYNVVILTLKRAAPKISRFLLCAMLIYGGFAFCGWLVLGPYHIKFRSLSTTSECLFALINGDDLFATFATITLKSNMMWWFSRIYLYSFISLYIYVVLSVFISVIMDSYDTIKGYYRDGFPKNDLKTFLGPLNLQDYATGVLDDEMESDSLADVVRKICCCIKKSDTGGPTGYTSLHSRRTD